MTTETQLIFDQLYEQLNKNPTIQLYLEQITSKTTNEDKSYFYLKNYPYIKPKSDDPKLRKYCQLSVKPDILHSIEQAITSPKIKHDILPKYLKCYQVYLTEQIRPSGSLHEQFLNIGNKKLEYWYWITLENDIVTRSRSAATKEGVSKLNQTIRQENQIFLSHQKNKLTAEISKEMDVIINFILMQSPNEIFGINYINQWVKNNSTKLLELLEKTVELPTNQFKYDLIDDELKRLQVNNFIIYRFIVFRTVDKKAELYQINVDTVSKLLKPDSKYVKLFTQFMEAHLKLEIVSTIDRLLQQKYPTLYQPEIRDPTITRLNRDYMTNLIKIRVAKYKDVTDILDKSGKNTTQQIEQEMLDQELRLIVEQDQMDGQNGGKKISKYYNKYFKYLYKYYQLLQQL